MQLQWCYILVRGDITIAWDKETQVAFKNYAPFTKCITKIDGPTVDDDADDQNLAMPTYTLLEYSSNYSDIPIVSGFILKRGNWFWYCCYKH